MPRASIPVVLKMVAENDPSIKRELESLEKQLEKTGEKTAEKLKAPFEQLEQATSGVSKKIREALSKEVAGAVEDTVKEFKRAGVAAGAMGKETVKAAQQTAKGVTLAEQAAAKAGETVANQVTGRIKQRAKDTAKELKDSLSSAGDFLGSTLGRFQGFLRDKLGVGRGGILGDADKLFGSGAFKRGFSFGELDLPGLEKLQTALGDKFGKLKQIVAGVAAAGVASLATLSLTLGGLGAAAISTAAKFETFEVKLETVLKSTAKAKETMRDAITLAAKTPFTVEGLIQGAVQLEVYGQRSKEILPLVADLAAGMGKRIEDTSLVVGKALSGSLEGFESLRNEYGISTAKLARYGATLDSMGRLAIKNSDSLEKTRQALLRIIAVDFGGAVERQSRTFTGAVSNLQDAVINLAADFGAPLLNFATGIVTALTGVLTFAGKIPPSLKQIGAEAALAITIFSGLGAAIGGVALAGLGLAAVFKRLAAAEVLAAIPGLTANLLGLGGGFAAVGSRAASFLLAISNTAPVVAGLTAIGLVLNSIANGINNEQLRIAEGIKAQADAFTTATNSLHTYRDALKGAGADTNQLFGPGSAEAFAKELQSTLATTDKFKLIANLRQKGLDLQGLRETSNDLEKQSDQSTRLRDLFGNNFKDGKLLTTGVSEKDRELLSNFLKEKGLTASGEKQIIEHGHGQSPTVLESLVFQDPAKAEEAIKFITEEANSLEKAKTATNALTKAYEELGLKQDALVEGSKQFELVSRVALKNKDDVQGLNVAYSEAVKRVKEAEEVLKQFGVTNVSKAEILKRLADPSIRNDPRTLQFFEDYIKAVDQADETLDLFSKREKQQVKERLNGIKFAADYENSLREGTIRKEEDELKDRAKILEKELAQVKGYAAKRIQLEQELQKVLAQINAAGPFKDPKDRQVKVGKLQDKADSLRRDLGSVDEFANLEISLNQEKQTNKKQQLTLKANQAKENLQTFVDERSNNAKDLLAEENFTGARSEITSAQEGLKGLQKANQDLINQSPELRRAFEQAFGRLDDQLRSLDKQTNTERFRQLGNAIRDALSEAETPYERLLVLGEARKLIESETARGMIAQRDSAAELTRITEQEGQIRRATLKDVEKQEKAIRGERLALLEQEKGYLEQLTAHDLERLKIIGQGVDLQKRQRDLAKEILRGKIENLRENAAEEIKQFGNKEQVQSKFAAQVLQLLRDTAAQNLQKAQQAREADDDKQRAIRRKGKIGGANSPLLTFEAAHGIDPDDPATDTNETTGVNATKIKQSEFGRKRGEKGAAPTAAEESVLAAARAGKNAQDAIVDPNKILASLGTSVDALNKTLADIKVEGKLDIAIQLSGSGAEGASVISSDGEGIGIGARTTVNGMFSDNDREGRNQSKTRGGKFGA